MLSVTGRQTVQAGGMSRAARFRIRACLRQAKRGQEQPSPLSDNVARNWPSMGRAMQAKSPLAVEIFALGARKA
jgi:hypothetical protein